MKIAEVALYRLAHAFYRSEVAHSSSMKTALESQQGCDRYRSQQVSKVLDAAQRFGIPIANRDVLDLGCNDGALTQQYLPHHPRSLTGVDVDPHAIERARAACDDEIDFRVSEIRRLPVADGSMDVILCYDVFEHVSNPLAILAECRRVLRRGGQMLIGTWGWFHPFAPHLWSTMPVPWAHVMVSERTLLGACRRVYNASWYVPTFHDVDETGRRKTDKYTETSLSTDYLNKYRIRDFERVFAESGLRWKVHLQPFGSVPGSAIFLRLPLVREFLHGYLWAVLEQRA